HRDLALPLDVPMEQRIHDGGTASGGENLAAETDQSACRDVTFEPDSSRTVFDHLYHLAFASAEFLDHDAQRCFWTIDNQHLDWLVQRLADRCCQDLGLPDRQFITLAPHRLDQDSQLQFASTHDAEGIRPTRLLDSNRDISKQLFFQT